MNTFFRFPHTPHLIWLGEGEPRDDKVLSEDESQAMLDGPVVVEEKLDGANIGFSHGPEGIRVQNRGSYLHRPFRGQFTRLDAWMALHQEGFRVLPPHCMLFGEWCAACHSLEYSRLSDWFNAFDIYDLEHQAFMSTARRDELCHRMGIETVPQLVEGNFTIAELKGMLAKAESACRPGGPEGLVIRKERNGWLELRAKLVQPGFLQSIGEHWSRREIRWNRLGVQPNRGDFERTTQREHCS